MKRLFACLVLASCTFTTTSVFTPDFKVSADSLGAALDSLIPAQHFQATGIKKSTNGKASAIFELRVTNGKNIPSDDVEMRLLARSVARYLKSVVKNDTAYNFYDIRFEKISN